jgi:formate-dependent nitrite reductase membrane component NrfD
VVFTAVTTALLVFDLEKPVRFLRVLTRPQWRSWLTRGAYILVGFSGLATIWALLEFLNVEGFARTLVLAIGILFAVGSAVYTAFLFGQAEGRDLWQGALLPIHLLVQAFMAGAAATLVIGSILGQAGTVDLGVVGLTTAIVVDLIVLFLGEFAMPHASDAAALASREIKSGRFKWHFWLGAVFAGHVLPLFALALGVASIPACILVVVGLYYYEYAFVTAPQQIPNS